MHLKATHVIRCGYNRGPGRASPEWLSRGFRLGATMAVSYLDDLAV